MRAGLDAEISNKPTPIGVDVRRTKSAELDPGPLRQQVAATCREFAEWYRWTTLAMLALAFLSIAAATEHTSPPPAGQIPLARNEIAALFGTLITRPVTDTGHRLRWSAGRRRHQHRAKTCHYQRQAAQDP